MTVSETVHSPWIPYQVASGAMPGVSNRPESTGDNAALAWSVSSLRMSSRTPHAFCVWLNLISLCEVGCFFFCIFHHSLDLSTGVIFLVSKKKNSGCLTFAMLWIKKWR